MYGSKLVFILNDSSQGCVCTSLDTSDLPVPTAVILKACKEHVGQMIWVKRYVQKKWKRKITALLPPPTLLVAFQKLIFSLER